jgi:phosphoribosylformylglycinamidine (FGAM) synthase-like amidotransferase family enzyme/selenophosphate synthetase-related protein
MNKRIGIIRYPGSNCDIETLDYFGIENSFYIWHMINDIKVLDNIDLLVLPGGFAFGDRIYDKATDNYLISPGTMALNSPVTDLIREAVKKSIPILGICNGFQILTQLKLLPGTLELNNNECFTCKKVKCIVNHNNTELSTNLYIANSYGKYMNSSFDYDKYKIFLKYENNEVAGICDLNNKIFGMMPHPERNNYDFKHILFDLLFQDNKLTTQLLFDKCIKDLMFSEHISYKTSRKYLKNLHTKEDWVVQGPGENAGIVDIGTSSDGTEYCIAIRIESHNHPTYIDPFEGAATGVGGILRDIFTMGARPIGILDFLRFGNDDDRSNYLLENAIRGISYYGNCIGVPNIGGDLYMHESYNKNPLVNVACLGIVKKENIIYGNALNENSVLIYVGSKTGNEGINGAAMASNTFDNDTNTEDLKSNIQKSDPFLEKLLLEACCEISELGLVEGMQDMGAGGLLCATLEVVKRGREKTGLNMGCDIYLKTVPTKYEMEYQNILISESQERMLIVCKKENENKIFEIFEKWDLEYSSIGKTTLNGKYNLYDDVELLYTNEMSCFNDIHDYTNISLHKNTQSNNTDAEKIKEPILWECYDSTIGNRTLKGPDKPGSYSVLNIHEVEKQLILTWGESFEECYDAMKSFEGINPLCIVNCLNFGDPKYCMCDFKNTIEKLNIGCKTFNIPVVGGNVSLYNSTGDQSIRPTPVLVMMGISQ